MPSYTDKSKAQAHWWNSKRYMEFKGSPRLQKIYDQKIQELILQGTIVESSFEQVKWINPAHLVPKPNGDMRLVVDMRLVNQFMREKRFKMEGVSTLKQLWEKNDYAISWDLKEAYNHVPVHESLQLMLGIAHKGKIYKHVGMPFGLSDAPRVFSEIMKKVVKAIRCAWNVKAVVYLDDLLLLHPDPEHLRKIQREVTRFLQWLG
jgi:hypothetical protein